MSFKTKTGMWWGTVKTNTEHFFGKEQKRIVTHEYYDNPNAPSQRPKSMHTIASQSRRSLGGDNNASSRAGQGFSKKKSNNNIAERKSSSKAAGGDYQEGVATPAREVQYPQDTSYDAQQQYAGGEQDKMMMGDGTYPAQVSNMGGYDSQAPQQWGGGYDNGQDPNMMLYPQDPNMVGYDPQQQGMMYPQDPNMMLYPQDPNMMGYDPQQQGMMYPQDPNGMMYQPQGMYPQDQSMFPQHPPYSQQQQADDY